MHSVALLGEELRPIQGGEQQSPSAVFYSATVVDEEALGEDIQDTPNDSVLQCTVHQQYDCTLVILHSHTFSMSKRRSCRYKQLCMHIDPMQVGYW